MKPFKILALLTAACSLLAGCATNGAPQSGDTAVLVQLAIQGVTVAAVGNVVKRDHADATLQAQRAAKIVAVASALKSLGDDSLASLPVLTQALAPLLDKAHLDPLERQQADLLVQALVTVALKQTDAGKYIATVRVLLDGVIAAASFYVPANPD